MPRTFSISVTYLDTEPRFHGRGDHDLPEWPPSPLRLYQAVVAANGQRLGTGSATVDALRWLESQPPPVIVAPPGEPGQPLPVYVPNNAMDLTAKAWAKGAEVLTKGNRPEDNKTLKTFRPTHLRDGNTVHYLWPTLPAGPPLDVLSQAVGRLSALGWGIDLAVAQARLLDTDATLKGQVWKPSESPGGNALRVPLGGTLDALIRRHEQFLNRVDDDGFRPVPPISAMKYVNYRLADGSQPRPFRVFELRRADGGYFAHPHGKLIHLAGMVRHLAIRSSASDAVYGELYPGEPRRQTFATSDLPASVATTGDWPDADEWVRRYIAGHREPGAALHRQLSYLPLPSIGHTQTNPSVRRVMVAGQPGDGAMVDWIADRLAGQRLRPDDMTRRQGMAEPPLLVPVRSDPVISHYTGEQRRWATVTPAILPGFTDRKAGKTRSLIRKALAQAGIEQPCRFRWSEISRFPKSLAANAGRGGKKSGRGPNGYIRPDHMQKQSAVHLEIEFAEGAVVAGPLAIGSGRHCGLGLLAHHPDPSALIPPDEEQATGTLA